MNNKYSILEQIILFLNEDANKSFAGKVGLVFFPFISFVVVFDVINSFEGYEFDHKICTRVVAIGGLIQGIYFVFILLSCFYLLMLLLLNYL